MSTVRLYFKNEAFETVDIIAQGANGLNYSSLEWESIFHQQDKFSLQCGVSNPADVERILDRQTVYSPLITANSFVLANTIEGNGYFTNVRPAESGSVNIITSTTAALVDMAFAVYVIEGF